ncbi:MAG: hypothetical protein GF308_01270 [Candidatus Heimdallarchaeota archaeon]|nr:hypothetical protein [Candidatus Heimdallarchaeota archaeon]
MIIDVQNKVKLEIERQQLLEKIVLRYKEISLKKLAIILRFETVEELENWIINLPSKMNFYIKNKKLIIPKSSQNENEEVEKAISNMLNKFKEFESKTDEKE